MWLIYLILFIFNNMKQCFSYRKQCWLVFFSFGFMAGFGQLRAQESHPPDLHATVQSYLKQGDYANALLVLNNALKEDPRNLELLKDQAFTYYLQKKYEQSAAVGRKLLENKEADVKAYQIAALPYKATENMRELDRIYKKGLKAFPNSGVLHNEYGEVLWTKQNPDAIVHWEKGIEAEPNYPGNYYNAAKYYYHSRDKVWSLIYGELFINMESYTTRTVEMKNILLASYKKFFTDTDNDLFVNDKNSFVKAYVADLQKQASLASRGINPESLIMIRTRFILDWYERNFSSFPFRLFEYHQQLLKEGLFEAYNQWLFGSTQDLTAFQVWINGHAEEYQRFLDFQKGRVFKMPSNHYYNN